MVAAARLLLLAALAGSAWVPARSVRVLKQASAGARIPGSDVAAAPGPAVPSQPCAAADAALLLAFKASFDNGADVLDTWRPGSDCCAWEGISCNTQGRVVAVVRCGEGAGCTSPPPPSATTASTCLPLPAAAPPLTAGGAGQGAAWAGPAAGRLGAARHGGRPVYRQ